MESVTKLKSKRVPSTKIGDIFCVHINENTKRYFQYIISDFTQLNSDVIRGFKRAYSSNRIISLEEIVDGEVDFYTHTDTKAGIKMGLWEKVGNNPRVGNTEHILFRSSRDLGNQKISIRDLQNWYVWRINEPFRFVGDITPEVQKAEMGLVMSPYDIVEKLKTGKYGGWIDEVR